MKIEKVNDSQIRCTLSKEDLAERQIKLSELAYGTEKAKSLFRDMMQQTSFEFGFEAENIPLMIEAIPLSTESIILIITKVEDPDELDTRFSNFSPSKDDDDDESPVTSEDNEIPILEGGSELLDLLNKLKNGVREARAREEEAAGEARGTESASSKNSRTKLFILSSFDDVEKVSKIVAPIYDGDNELFHNLNDDNYYLFLHRGEHSADEFNKICNILSEYAIQKKYTPSVEAFFNEHYSVLMGPKALQTLFSL